MVIVYLHCTTLNMILFKKNILITYEERASIFKIHNIQNFNGYHGNNIRHKMQVKIFPIIFYEKSIFSKP